jgi:quercetin dioxygenase-like cupin family protein
MLHSTRTPWRAPFVAAVAVLIALAVACDDDGGSSSSPTTDAAGTDGTTSGTPSASAEVLLDADTETILDQPVDYPGGEAEVSSAIVTIPPGGETGWHHHDAPMYAYVLSGEVVVDYGDEGERTYRAGDAFIEAVGTSHNGRNPGAEPVEILAVNIGAAGVENTVEDPAP